MEIAHTLGGVDGRIFIGSISAHKQQHTQNNVIQERKRESIVGVDVGLFHGVVDAQGCSLLALATLALATFAVSSSAPATSALAIVCAHNCCFINNVVSLGYFVSVNGEPSPGKASLADAEYCA